MSGHASKSVIGGFSRRSLARIVYLGIFVGLYYGTSLFQQYQPLLWVALAGLIVVFFDAVICARRRWRVVKQELREEERESEPNC